MPDGRIGPGLASEWSCEEEGRVHVFSLRPGARFHDGTAVDAEAVRLHFKRWIGLPEHSWLESSERIEAVDALDPGTLRIRLSEPDALLPDLLAINPCAITAPAAIDRHGEWLRPVGSGPFRFVELGDEGRLVRCARFNQDETSGDEGTLVDYVLYASDDERSPLDALLAGELDALVDTWYETIPRARLADVLLDERFHVRFGPGGSVTCLTFQLEKGPTSDASVRRRIAVALDREELLRAAERDLGQVCSHWAPPTILDWPREPYQVRGGLHGDPLPVLRFLRRKLRSPEEEPDSELHEAIAAQLRRAGMEVEIRAAEATEFSSILSERSFDLLLMHTLGVPYDPQMALTCFLPPKPRPAADSRRRILTDPELSSLVVRARRCFTDDSRRAAHRRIEERLQEEAIVVPLYVPSRVAIVRSDRNLPVMDHDIYRVDLVSMTEPVGTAR